MKIGHLILFSLTTFCFSSCVGMKKYKALQEEKTKLENTFLKTKTDLSVAKRELNKFKDASNLSSEEKSSKITTLQQQLQQKKEALNNTNKSFADCQKQKQAFEQTYQQEKVSYEKKVKPLLSVQNEIKVHHRALKSLETKIKTAFMTLGEEEPIPMSTVLDKYELILTLDHSYLFSLSSRSLSSTGKNLINTLADILLENKDVLLTVKGHSTKEANYLDNWKTSSRKPLSIIYTLAAKGVANERMQAAYYGAYNSPVSGNRAEPNRTEIILHYPNKHLLKLIPIK